jgi:hypothetical protein
MRWKGERRSENVEDRRDSGTSFVSAAAAAPLLLRFLPALIRSKLGRTILIGGVLAVVGGRLLGVDVLSMFLGGGGAASSGLSARFSEQEQEMAEFASVVLADTEDTWNAIFRAQGTTYREPTLVLFSGRVNSACGMATAAVGPFYCPGDQHLYVDLSFFHDLKVRHGAPGDFAQAYVIAMRSRCARNCRQTVSPVSGVMPPRISSYSTPAISRRHCAPPRPLAMTDCSAKPGNGWSRTASRMAAPSSGCGGSASASRVAIPPAAIPSRPVRSE